MATTEAHPPATAVERAAPSAERFSAELHRRALPDAFFVALGPRFLAAYHESFRASPHGVALTAWLDGRPVGMLVGTTANSAHHRWVVRNRGARLTAVGVVALLLRPALAAHFARTRAGRYVRKLGRYLLRSRGADGSPERPSEPEAGKGEVAVLTHVAVEESARGHGLGRALVETFVSEAAAAGAARAELVTDADNEANHAFYRRLGWAPVEDRPDSDGDCKTRFVRHLR